MTADKLPPEVRDKAAQAVEKIDRDYGHWRDWNGPIDEFTHERALSQVDAVAEVLAAEQWRHANAADCAEAERDLITLRAQLQATDGVTEKLRAALTDAVEDGHTERGTT